ncbi:MAG TPA: ribonuclease P protein component [Holophagaceae bacterium]|nr:ribonuclease P protein component [Holophagaceae bacterium]
MEFRGAFRVLKRGDISAPPRGLRPLLNRDAALDVRRFPGPPQPPGPRLLVNAPRRAGSAVERNRFRRRVRMAFLALLRDEGLGANPGQVVWVRPGLGGCGLAFEDLLSLLRRALSRPDTA